MKMLTVLLAVLSLVSCGPVVAYAAPFVDSGIPDETETLVEPPGAFPDESEEFGEGEENEIALAPPFAVYLVEPPLSGEAEVVPYSDHGTAYPGTISTTVWQYFRDLAASLPLGAHYVFYRADRYRYNLVYSEDLTLSGSRFSASEVQIIQYDTYNSDNSLSRYSETSFSVSSGTAMVYSDLGDYPRLYEGVTHREISALLLLVAGGIIGAFVLRLFSY